MGPTRVSCLLTVIFLFSPKQLEGKINSVVFAFLSHLLAFTSKHHGSHANWKTCIKQAVSPKLLKYDWKGKNSETTVQYIQ